MYFFENKNYFTSNEQHQFNLLYVSRISFDQNSYKNMLTRVDFASRYKIAKAPMNKKESGVAFLLEAVYKKYGASKFPKVFSM